MAKARQGQSYDEDCEAVSSLVRGALAQLVSNPDLTTQERCSRLGKMLDGRNANSRSTNGLLAIAVDRLAVIGFGART